MTCLKSYLILDALMRRVFPLNFFFCFDSCSVSWRVSDFILRETVGRDCLIKVHQSTVPFFSPLSAQQEPDRLKYAAHCSLTALFIFLDNDAWIPYTSALLSRLALRYCALYSFFSFLCMHLKPLWQQRLYQATECGGKQGAILIDCLATILHLLPSAGIESHI